VALVRQLATECLLLWAIGGALGVGLPRSRSNGSRDESVHGNGGLHGRDVAIDLRVLAFAGSLTPWRPSRSVCCPRGARRPSTLFARCARTAAPPDRRGRAK
jgi:hypothetical protein